MQPGTQLTWDENSQFVFKGPEFGQLHNSLQAIIASPIYQEHLAIAKQTTAIGQLYELTSKKLQEGIDNGVVKPTEQPVDDKPMD